VASFLLVGGGQKLLGMVIKPSSRMLLGYVEMGDRAEDKCTAHHDQLLQPQRKRKNIFE